MSLRGLAERVLARTRLRLGLLRNESFPVEIECYAVAAAPVRARGIRFVDAELPDALGEEIREVVRDARVEEDAKRYRDA